MTLLNLVGLSFLGAAVGIVGGIVGVGGSVLFIPAMILFMGYPQRLANGTSLATLLPPIGVFAVIAYHRAGNVNWPVALVLAASFAPGAYVGAYLVQHDYFSDRAIRLGFGYLLLYIASRFLFRGSGVAGAALSTLTLIAITAIVRFWLRTLGRRLERAPYWPAVYRAKLAAPVEHDYEI